MRNAIEKFSPKAQPKLNESPVDQNTMKTYIDAYESAKTPMITPIVEVDKPLVSTLVI